MSRHPEVKWAQRFDKVYLTILLADAKNVQINLEPDGVFTFSGTAGSDNIPYELKLELYDKVNAEAQMMMNLKEWTSRSLVIWGIWMVMMILMIVMMKRLILERLKKQVKAGDHEKTDEAASGTKSATEAAPST